MIKGIIPQLAEAGKIKIGGLGDMRKSKTGNEWRPPVKLDHFLITKTTRDAKGDLEIDTDLMSAINTDDDGEVRAIPVVLHSDDIELIFPTSYALYVGKKCACRGDGETALKREIVSGKYTGNEKTVECPCKNLTDTTSKHKCKPNGKLYCSIAVPGKAVAGAVHIWRTTSIISIQRMFGSLQQIKSITGILRGIPLTLVVSPVVVDVDGVTSTVYCCHVELRASDIDEVQRRAIAASDMRRRLGYNDDQYKKMISLPAHNETEAEQAEIHAEFYCEEDATPTESEKIIVKIDEKKEAVVIKKDDGNPL